MTGLESFRGVALVQRGAEDVLAFAGGTTGAEPQADCTLATGFQIASVSKQFTATAVLLLADRGVLSVDDRVSRWVADCPASWSGISVRHLLAHTAGLVHWPDIPGLDLTAGVAAGEELRVFRHAALLSAPGERYYYSSPGYVLLARIVERAVGQPYASFLAREIFAPLGMTATFAGDGDGRPGLATGHQDGVPVPTMELATMGIGAGDVWSTARDLARWDQALAAGEILSAAARQAMFTVQARGELDSDVFGHVEGYGYGWRIARLPGGHRIMFHTGDNAGFLSVNAWVPREAVRVVLLTNEETTGLLAITGQALAMAFPELG